jgi:uncharacterized membrane protein YphA (DoxX/SURF4 family)
MTAVKVSAATRNEGYPAAGSVLSGVMTRLRAAAAYLAAFCLFFAFAAASAFAQTDGEGLLGETDDKIITFFCLGLVIFFTVFVIVASWIQGALDRRKQQRKAVELRKRVGW